MNIFLNTLSDVNQNVMENVSNSEKMLDNFISVIIINYNGLRFLKECLDSISFQSIKNYEIILVDNNSIDGSVGFIKTNYPQVRIIRCDTNYGFAKGNNIGIRNSIGRYAILLNNDTKVEPNFIETLHREITSKPNCGVVGAWTFNGSTPPVDRYSGGQNIVGYVVYGDFNSEPDPFLVAGCAFILDRNKIPVPFDDDYFLYCEDNYVAWLNKLKGYDAYNTKDTLVLHYGSGTAGNRSKIKVFFGERNRILNVILFYSNNTLVKLLPIIILTTIVAPLRALLVYRKETYVKEYLKGYLWIILHLSLIMEKRSLIQRQRRVSDEIILKLFTYRITGGRFSKVLNSIAKIYFTIVRIKSFDLV